MNTGSSRPRIVRNVRPRRNTIAQGHLHGRGGARELEEHENSKGSSSVLSYSNNNNNNNRSSNNASNRKNSNNNSNSNCNIRSQSRSNNVSSINNYNNNSNSSNNGNNNSNEEMIPSMNTSILVMVLGLVNIVQHKQDEDMHREEKHLFGCGQTKAEDQFEEEELLKQR
jgi:ATP-dependent Zn protease